MGLFLWNEGELNEWVKWRKEKQERGIKTPYKQWEGGLNGESFVGGVFFGMKCGSKGKVDLLIACAL